MKDYQLYLEKIVNALSRAGISFPAPNFTDYEGMCSYVAGLSSFLELNSQLQKAGAGIVLMGLEETTTFKSYWNSEFYLEFQERKLLESKLSSDNEEFDSYGNLAENSEEQVAKISSQYLEEELQEPINNEKENSEFVVPSPSQNNFGFDMSNVVFSDDDEEDDESSEDEYLEEELGEEVEEPSQSVQGYDMSNVVFVDDDDDEEEYLDDDVEYLDDDYEETQETSDQEDLSETETFNSFTNQEDSDTIKGVAFSQLEGCDTSNIVFSDDEEELEDVEEYEYDEDGFIIDRDEPLEDDDDEEDSEEEFLEEYEYDEDGFIIDRSEPKEEEDDVDDEEEYLEEFEYDEDGFIIDRSEPEEDDEEDEFEFIEDDEEEFIEEDFTEEDFTPVVDNLDDTEEYSSVRKTSPHVKGRDLGTYETPTPTKPQVRKPKELQETDRILSLFSGIEGKLRKKVQSVKKETKN